MLNIIIFYGILKPILKRLWKNLFRNNYLASVHQQVSHKGLKLPKLLKDLYCSQNISGIKAAIDLNINLKKQIWEDVIPQNV